MGNRNCPGQHHICQGLFPYYSRICPYFSIPMIIFQTFQGLENFINIFQTFPGSVRTLCIIKIKNSSVEQMMYSPCKAPSSGTPCRTTSMHSRTMSPIDSRWKPGFSLATSVLSALETLRQLCYINSHLPYDAIYYIVYKTQQ